MKFKVEVHTIRRIVRDLCALALALAASLFAQTFTTTSVQGTVFLASGKPAAGTVQISWPAFTTAAGQAVAAGHTALQLGSDGFLSVALTPNQGATPAGLYYTVVYNLSDGSTSTEYWTVPAAAQAAVSQVRSQVMPAAQAVQAVNKSYVDQAVSQIARSQITSGGGTMTGPLYLNGDPSSPTQAASKHYVDTATAGFMPKQGGAFSGAVTAPQLGGLVQVDQFTTSGDFGFRLQACIDHFAGTNGGACDARNFSGPQTLSADINIATANLSIYLPCSTISTARSIIVAPGTRNVTLHGCSSRGASAASGSEGGTVFLYSGSGTLFQIGDPAYLLDTMGFHFDNVVVNITPATSSSAQALAAWRTQEINLSSMYLLGNANQTAITLDGTGNYTGGTFQDMQLVGFQTAFNAIGHQITNAAPTDWLNASTFIRPHIVCPVNNGNPIAGTIGINLAQGDGNTFTGGDIEGCATALHLGPNAQNNTIVGLRTENSISQVIADAGSSYNNWVAGGTMFTGKLTDNGTRNSFMDTFHRSFNSLNGDWFGSQQDNTLTNHYRLGIGTGNERGLLTRYQTDSGYRWTTGLSDGTSGAQFYQVQDELNNVYRLSIGQYNPGQSSTNNQTVLNAAGTGAIVLNGSNNAGTGGVVFGSGGPSSTTIATIDKQGNANFTGTLQVGGSAQTSGTMTVRNNADAEVDYYLWPGHNTEQKGSFTYKDHTGASQWYMVKDASNNWALNSATGGLDSIKAYQSSNSGDTYINASNSSGAVRINYETGAGAAFNVYGGGSSNLYASFTAPNAIKFPGLAASSGKNCLHIDSSGYISNTGVDCSTGGSVNPGVLGQIAYYNSTGAVLAGTSTVPVSAGGTGAADPATALVNLGGVPATGGTMTGQLNGTTASFAGTVATGARVPTKLSEGQGVNVLAAGAKCDDSTDDTIAINNALNAGGLVILPAGLACRITAPLLITQPNTILLGYASRQFITSGTPSSYIDFQGTNQHALSVQAQGFVMQGVAIKYPSNTGAPMTPPAAPTLTATSGSAGAGTIYFETSCVTGFGTTLAGTEGSITVGASSGVIVNRPTCSGGSGSPTGWNVYAATNSHNETKQNTTVIPWSTTSFTLSTNPVNDGPRPVVDSTAGCAIYDPNAGKYHGVILFTGASTPPYGLANGFCLYNSSAQIDQGSFITGFNTGIVLQGGNNNVKIRDSFFQANNYGITVAGGAKIDIEGNDFEGNLIGNIWALGGEIKSGNYFEQQLLSGTTAYQIQFGAPSGTPQGEILSSGGATPPVNAHLEHNFFQCNGTSGTNPILIQQVKGLKMENNQFSNCGSQSNLVNNAYANPAANIRMLGNQADTSVTSWTSSLAGVVDYDFSTTAQALGPRQIPSYSVPAAAAFNPISQTNVSLSSNLTISASTGIHIYSYNITSATGTFSIQPADTGFTQGDEIVIVNNSAYPQNAVVVATYSIPAPNGAVRLKYKSGDHAGWFLASSNNAANMIGTLLHASLPPLVSGDIPNNSANTTGNAGTANAFAATPTQCSAGNYARGIDVNGNAQNCTSVSSASNVGPIYSGCSNVYPTGLSKQLFLFHGAGYDPCSTAVSYNVAPPLGSACSNGNITYYLAARIGSVDGTATAKLRVNGGDYTGNSFTIPAGAGAVATTGSLTAKAGGFAATDQLEWLITGSATSNETLADIRLTWTCN